MTGSWNDLTNPDGAGKMFILDDFQEAIGEANLINGWQLNTVDPNELEVSKQTLLDQKEFARGISTNSTQNLVNGTAVIHQAWNGDIVNVRNQVDDPENYSYETCKEGVPGRDRPDVHPGHIARARHRADVHRLDHPARATPPRTSMWNGYPQPVRGRQGGVRELVKDEPSIDVNLEALGGGGMEYRLDDRRRPGALEPESGRRSRRLEL